MNDTNNELRVRLAAVEESLRNLLEYSRELYADEQRQIVTCGCGRLTRAALCVYCRPKKGIKKS